MQRPWKATIRSLNTTIRTPYHYLPPSREVSASPRAVAAIEQVLRARGVEYLLGKTWTTDAYYPPPRER